MATVVNQAPDERAAMIGQALGGLLHVRRQKQAQEEEARLTGDLQAEISNAPDRKAAMQVLSNPRYERLMTNVEDVKAGASLVDKIHPVQKDKLTAVSISVPLDPNDPKGARVERQIFLPESKLSTTLNDTDLEFQTGVKGASFNKPAPLVAPKTELFFHVDSRGRVKDSAGFFEPGKQPSGTLSESAYNAQLRAATEARRAEAGKKADGSAGDFEISKSDSTDKAIGRLQRKGKEVNATNIRNEKANRELFTRGSKMLADSYGGTYKDEGGNTVFSFLNSKDNEASSRFFAAQSVLEQIIDEQPDISEGQAANIAKKAGFVAYPRIERAGGQAKRIDAFPEKISDKDKERKFVVGKVYEHESLPGVMLVYTGKTRDGKPNFAEVKQ